tara:strand:- start:339 stop:2522 length:2184 start_codon:yes stop_codon:yes gene_type:complete
MLYSFKTVGNKALVGGGVVEKGIPPTATNYWGLSSNNKNLRAQANMNPTTTTTTTNVENTKNVFVIATLSDGNVSWTTMGEVNQVILIDGYKNVLSNIYGVEKSKISVTGKDGSVVLAADVEGVPDDVDATDEEISAALTEAPEVDVVFNLLDLIVSVLTGQLPGRPTFSQRGWTYGTSYNPDEGTLFHAVDLISSDATYYEALVLYNFPSNWAFDFTNSGTNSIKDLSSLFASGSGVGAAGRSTDVSGWWFDIDIWDLSEVTDMSQMFKNASNFNKDIGSWNVSGVTDMNNMFNGASNFNKDIGNWDVSGVTNMQEMFRSAQDFNQDIGNWNVSNVTNMKLMFDNASNFNQDISEWDVSEVTAMDYMFNDATYMSQNISVWDVSSVEVVFNVLGNFWFGFQDIFNNSAMADVLNIYDVSGGDNATLAALGDASDGSWFTGPFTPYTFKERGWQGGAYTPDVDTLFYAVDLYSNEASRNEAIIAYGFINTWQFDFNANNGDLKDFSKLFYPDAGVGTTRPTDVSGFNFDIGNWDVSGVTNMSRMFSRANAFNKDIDSWDVGNVNNMNAMFQDDTGNIIFNKDIGSWNVSNVTNMANMFQGASSFNNGGSSSINNWDVSGVTDMRYMFGTGSLSNSSFNQDISGWNVSNVTDMSLMFSGGFNFTAMSQNISVWDTSTNTIPGYNRIFTSMFQNSNMSLVQNSNGKAPTDNAAEDVSPVGADGSWFLGP